MADINKSILTALEAGYSPQEIMDHIKTSDDPAHQEWYSTYSANMADRSKEPSVGSIYYNNGGVAPAQDANIVPEVKPKPSVGTPLLDAAQNLTPTELIGGGIIAATALKAPSLYNAAQERKLNKERLSLEERRIKAYEAQVGKQGMAPEVTPATPTAPESPKLSPLEEARINTERARAEAIQSKIALEERRVAALEAKAKALAEAKVNKPVATPKPTEIQLTPTVGVVPPTAGPTPVSAPVPVTTEVGNPPKEMGLVKAGAANTVKNQIAEEIKAKEEPLKPVAPPKATKPKLEMPEGWGKGMSWLVNQHGVEGAQDFINRYNEGKPFASYDDMMKAYQEKTTRPKYSDIPKDVRKSRGIVPPQQTGATGMGVRPPATGGGGRLNETGRPGEEIIHNLNPLKL